MYTEVGWKGKGNKAVLLSPEIATGPKCVNFWYHMYGSGIGNLYINWSLVD